MMFIKNIFKSSLILISFLTLIGFSFSTLAEPLEDEPDQYVTVSAFAKQTTVTGGEIIRIAVAQKIYPKWHTYWINPGDSGLASSIEWELPEGFNVTAIEWPTPSKIPFSELTNYGYEDHVTFLQNLSVPASIGADPITIKGKLNVLVCHDVCIPEEHPIEITLNGDSDAQPDAIAKAESLLPIKSNVGATYHVNGDNVEIIIKSSNTDINTDEAYIAPEEWGLVHNSGVLSVEKNTDSYVLKQQRGERDLSEIKSFPFVVGDKTSGKAYRIIAKPVDKSAAVIAPASPLVQKKILEKTSASASQQNDNSITFVKAFIFALLGGLVLNLMPCVFPVLSMKALSLVQLSGKEEAKARLYGLSYTAGILLSFGIIAAILIALKSAGAEIGWGFQLQNPIVISLLTYLIFVLGLNLFGFFELTGSFTNLGQKLTHQSGNKGAFFTGVLATLVATPCTAPFMGVAMGYALTQGAVAAMLIFFSLGFGLALPYLALCFIPALRTKLPKPGAWMEIFKEFLSFPMFLTAAFLVWVLSQQAGSGSVLIILSAMIAIVLAIWLWRHKPKGGILKALNYTLLLVSVVFAFYAPFTLKSVETPTTPSTSKQYVTEQKFNPEKLETLLKGDEAVFTNMTAAWCITCKVNERVAIKVPSVQEALKNKNVQYLKGDWTNRNAEITQYLNSFGRQGVPLYVYYGARDTQTGQRPEPVLLPQILTPSIMKDIIK